MAEQTLLNEQGVLVTNTRFVVNNATHAMSGVVGVAGVRLNPSRKGPIILIVVGVLLAIVFVGIPMIIGGIVWLILQKPRFAVVFTTAAGEMPVYESRDEAFISRIVEALNQAIVARG